MSAIQSCVSVRQTPGERRFVSVAELTHEDHSGLRIFRNLLQQLQLMFGFGTRNSRHQGRLLLLRTETTRNVKTKTKTKVLKIKLSPRLTWTSFFSMSIRVSTSPGARMVLMSGSVTDGSAGWLWLALWWCVIRLPRLAAEMFLGKGLLCSFSSLG